MSSKNAHGDLISWETADDETAESSTQVSGAGEPPNWIVRSIDRKEKMLTYIQLSDELKGTNWQDQQKTEIQSDDNQWTGTDSWSSPFKTLKVIFHRPIVAKNPNVLVSIWDTINHSWRHVETDGIRLHPGPKALKLESVYRQKSDGLESKQRNCLIISSLGWEIGQRAKMNTHLEKDSSSSTPDQHLWKMNGSYKPVFYFEISHVGELGKVDDKLAPKESLPQLRQSSAMMNTIQETISSILAWQPGSPTWIRLESLTPRTDEENPMPMLADQGGCYRFVKHHELPCKGARPFLGPGGVPQPNDLVKPTTTEAGRPDAEPENLRDQTLAQNKPPNPRIDSESTGLEFKTEHSRHNDQRPLSPPKTPRAPSFLDIQNTTESESTRRVESRSNSSEADLLQTEKHIMGRLQDIDREIVLLRERQALMEKLGDVRAQMVTLRR